MRDLTNRKKEPWEYIADDINRSIEKINTKLDKISFKADIIIGKEIWSYLTRFFWIDEFTNDIKSKIIEDGYCYGKFTGKKIIINKYVTQT